MVSLALIRRTVILFSLLTMIASPLYAQDWMYTTRPGDNLWDLSKKYLASMSYWRKLQALNNIENPREMPPGTQLRFPIAWLKVQPVSVRVLEVSGTVVVVSGGSGLTRELSAGSFLYVDDEVRTEGNSSVVLSFADGSQLLLQSDSQLRLDMIRAYGDTGMVDSRVRLNHGRVDTQIVPTKGPEGRFEVHTPSALSAVRGTAFRMSSDLSKQTSMTEVIIGRVDVSAEGQTQVVPAGFGTVIKAGEPPLAPKPLLPPPDLSDLSKVFHQQPVEFQWPELKGALGYRVQLAPNDQFMSLLKEVSLTTHQFVMNDLLNGHYALRIRGFDEFNLGGKDAIHRFTVDIRPDPPQLLEPLSQASVFVGEEVFRWSSGERHNFYHFQLADNAEFKSPIIDLVDYVGNAYNDAEALAPGQYYWRVAAAEHTGKYGVFSPPQSVGLRAPLSSPQLETPLLDDQQLVFRWQSSPYAQAYEYELAHDADFEQIVKVANVSETQLILPRPSSGQYYFRVRPIAMNGDLGPYSVTRSVEVLNTNKWPPIISIMITFIFYLL